MAMPDKEATLQALDKLREYDRLARQIEHAAEVFSLVANALKEPLRTFYKEPPDMEYGTKNNLSIVSVPALEEVGRLLYDFQQMHYELSQTPDSVDPNVKEMIRYKLRRYSL